MTSLVPNQKQNHKEQMNQIERELKIAAAPLAGLLGVFAGGLTPLSLPLGIIAGKATQDAFKESLAADDAERWEQIPWELIGVASKVDPRNNCTTEFRYFQKKVETWDCREITLFKYDRYYVDPKGKVLSKKLVKHLRRNQMHRSRDYWADRGFRLDDHYADWDPLSYPE